jgi:hypothetical protein
VLPFPHFKIGTVRAPGSHDAAIRCGSRNLRLQVRLSDNTSRRRITMDGIIYLIGLIVIIMAILSFFGLR